MARIRTIKPEYWSDATISKLSIFTQLFYIALWNFADDAGRGRANAKELNGLAFSERDDVENRQIEAALLELADAGRIILYIHAEVRLFQILKWAQHQVINKPTRSRFPAPEGHSDTPINNVREECSSVTGGLPEECSSVQGMEGGIWKAEGGSGKLEVGRRKAEGGAGEEGPGETTSAAPVDPQAVSAPPASAFLEQAPVPPASIPSTQEKPPPERVITVCLEPQEWQDLLASGPPGGPNWTRVEIWTGLEILSERREPPEKPKGLLHSKILPEVRAGTKKPSRIANAPLVKPVQTQEEQAFHAAELDKLNSKLERAVAGMKAKEEAERHGTSTNGTTGTKQNRNSPAAPPPG